MIAHQPSQQPWKVGFTLSVFQMRNTSEDLVTYQRPLNGLFLELSFRIPILGFPLPPASRCAETPDDGDSEMAVGYRPASADTPSVQASAKLP